MQAQQHSMLIGFVFDTSQRGSHAIQVEGPTEIHVCHHAKDGKEVGKGNKKHQIAAEEGTKETRPLMLVPIGRNVFVGAANVKRITLNGEQYVIHYFDTRDVDVVQGADALSLRRFLNRIADGGSEERKDIPRMNQRRRS
jgi:hypothetical protein